MAEDDSMVVVGEVADGRACEIERDSGGGGTSVGGEA